MTRALPILLLALLLARPAAAEPLTPAEAVACASQRYRGEALAVREHPDETELRWLTPANNVLRIRLEGPGCRFLEVEGVGLIGARILPGEAR